VSGDATRDATTFGALLRSLRTQRGWSLSDLSERIRFNRGYIGNIEIGEKFPQRHFAEHSDRELGAAGVLLSAWNREHAQRRTLESTGRLLTASVADSLRLITAADADSDDLDALRSDGFHLPIDYLAAPAARMLLDAVEVRAKVLQRLRTHHFRPSQLTDLYQTLAVIQGVLAYAALDLGHPSAAATHAQATWAFAERIDSNSLRAWARGTESLILRFEKRYEAAESKALDGLRYAASGTARLRLLSGIAQSRANLGDFKTAQETLNLASSERESPEKPTSEDPVRGIFEFTPAKQHYYAGSSLMWSDEKLHLEIAAREAGLAISIWEQEPAATRSLDDEALAHIYAATAYVKLRQLDRARESLEPILSLPAERKISWILARLQGIVDILDHSFSNSVEAMALRGDILNSIT
jgi:transcriptional regulator with XRE-family HTH domain